MAGEPKGDNVLQFRLEEIGRALENAEEKGGGGGPPGEPPSPEQRAQDFTEEALALGFAAQQEEDTRYVAQWARWMSFDGQVWREDKTLHVFDQARGLARAVAASCEKPNVAKQILTHRTVAAIASLARADRRIAATVEQWDLDPNLLNAAGVVFDLRTGESRPVRRDDYMTKMAAVRPGGNCPQWEAFLHKVTAGDGELILFLQRVCGYCLTGLTIEHALFFLYGTGANGKSVFLQTLMHIMGDYAKAAPIETFTVAMGERHPTELASLRGARLVTSVETEEGRRWAESRIKLLTGGDRISARFMRTDFFEFEPVFKLMIAGNHRPQLRNVDEAMRRRFHLVPFDVTIPEGERDERLTEKLRAEAPGILAWMIEGAQEWDMNGLAPPERVRLATEDYLQAEDTIAAWILDECERRDDAWSSSAELFASWRAWADRAGESFGSQKRFSQRLAAHGVLAKRQARTGTRGFQGLLLKSAVNEQGELM